MDEVLVWQIVAVLIGGITIIIAIIGIMLNFKKKSLTYRVVEDINLVTIANSIKDRIEILIDKKKVNDCSLKIIRITNSGNVPIKKDDFDENLIIYCGEESVIHEVIVFGQNPSNLNVKFTSNSNSIVLVPLLMNPKDYFELKILVSDPKGLVISGRIVGVKVIKDLTTKFEDYIILSEKMASLNLGASIAFSLVSGVIDIKNKNRRKSER